MHLRFFYASTYYHKLFRIALAADSSCLCRIGLFCWPCLLNHVTEFRVTIKTTWLLQAIFDDARCGLIC